MKYRYLIIADDFTGANDTGIQMKKRGINVDVLLDAKIDSSSIVLDTESRNLSNKQAYDKVTNLSSDILSNTHFDIVYKKVDSTLRGNIAYELKAIAEIYKPDKIVFAPALPKLGRTTIMGVQYLNDKPLMSTELTKDPLSPIITDDLRNILAQTFEEDIKCHSTNELVCDSFDIGKEYLHIYDIHSDNDITILSKQLLALKQKILYVGSAGLAEGLFSAMHPAAPALGIVGSISQVSINQLNYAKSEGVNVISIHPKNIFDMASRGQYVDLIVQKIRLGLDVVVTSCIDRQDYEETISIAKKKLISQAQSTQLVKDYLSLIAEDVLSKCSISGIFLTGGDVAASIINKIGALGCTIDKEVSPGIVMSHLIHPVYSNIKIITKAGAFGCECDLLKGLNKLKEQ